VRRAYDQRLHRASVALEEVMAINFTAAIVLARAWWAFLLRGILGIVFGVIVLLFPAIGLIAVLALFAAWAIIGGTMQLVTAWQGRQQKNWWVGILEGLAGVAAGVIAIIWPDLTALALLFIIAFWAIVTGVLQIVLAIRMREQIRGELFLGLAGLIAVLFGLVLVINPGAGLLSVLWLVGIFAIAIGATFFLLGLRLRRVFDQARRQNEYGERGLPQ
jgi:uncharacterized membrane protein HdeD (DUF308 family)